MLECVIQEKNNCEEVGGGGDSRTVGVLSEKKKGNEYNPYYQFGNITLKAQTLVLKFKKQVNWIFFYIL